LRLNGTSSFSAMDLALTSFRDGPNGQTRNLDEME